MSSIRNATLLLAGALLACAPGAGSAPDAEPDAAGGPVTLAYAAQRTPLTYEATDSGSVRMEIPQMGAMDIVFDLSTTSQLALTRAGDALEGTVTLAQLKGQMYNPQAGTTAVDNSVLPKDPARFTLSRAGDLVRSSLPELSRNLREVTTATTLFYDQFVRLPHGPVRPGAVWVDTVEVNDQMATLSMAQRHEIRSTYAGDTVVAGRRLAHIVATSAITMRLAGDANGMQIEQRLVGDGKQSVLWDAARGILVERRFENTASGSMTIAGAGIGDIPVTQRSRSTTRLKEAG